MRKGQVLFTYLHLAASRPCTDALLDSGITAIAYETVQLPDRSLPLLAPMSEVAGRMAPQVGARCLEREAGGRGILMGGVSGVYAAKVVVLGAGVAGHERGCHLPRHAGGGVGARQQHRATSSGRPDLPGSSADRRLELLRDREGVHRRRSRDRSGARRRGEGAEADSRRAGRTDEARRGPGRHCHRSGRLLRVVAAHNSRRADISRHDTLFYCVANMPGAVPHTSTYALTNVTLPYALAIANLGWRDACRTDPALASRRERPRRSRRERAGRRRARPCAPDARRRPSLRS